MVEKSEIPSFYLYGEPHRFVGDNFVHVEALDDRSRPSEWTIKPHSHVELCHIFLATSGGGRLRADGQEIDFTAPCLLFVPATTVHGFQWFADSTGTVLTMANRYVDDLSNQDEFLENAFNHPRIVKLAGADLRAVEQLMATLMRELSWSAPGHRAAVNSAVLSLLVFALRRTNMETRPATRPGPQATVVARLRERIEQRFRLRETVKDYAKALGISESALRVACAKIAGASPMQMLDQRSLLEARRLLLYSNLSVAEIAYGLGFSDPAYFSRFFSNNVAASPSAYRNSRSH